MCGTDDCGAYDLEHCAGGGELEHQGKTGGTAAPDHDHRRTQSAQRTRQYARAQCREARGGGSAPLAAEVPAWQALYPEMYAPEAERSTIDEPKTVYLTFDDGPSVNTTKILDILDEYDIKATFFNVGVYDNEETRRQMKEIVDRGHVIGIHSYFHEYKDIYTSTEAFLDDYNRIYQMIYEATGIYPAISRFPGGSINGYDGVIYKDIVSELVRRGFVYFDWNVDSGDAAESGLVPAWKIERNALAKVDTLRRAVILMHDSATKPTTVEALPAIIEGYRDAGFTFGVLTPEVVPVVYIYPG